mmetsp:Transcript_38326/g.58411  ORF Transcript_38326/g.58411 Transcript_38326/m.58411 type:complete len:82 (-) Transcript_38326:731-976(-)
MDNFMKYDFQGSSKIPLLQQLEAVIKKEVTKEAQIEFDEFYKKHVQSKTRGKLCQRLKRMPPEDLFEVVSVRFSFRNSKLL